MVRGGERVVLVGYPARSQLGGVNVTEGIVSGLRGALGDQSRFQYTAPTQPGNSGGPVLDGSGSVVGVVVSQIDKISGERTAQNINFGIKLDLVRTFLAANNVTPAEGEAGAPLATRTSCRTPTSRCCRSTAWSDRDRRRRWPAPPPR